MPSEVMIDGNWWGQVKEKAKPQYVTWDAQNIKVDIDFDKDLYAKLDKDPLLLQKLSDGGSTAYKAFIKECVEHVEWAEKLIGKHAAAFAKDQDSGKFTQELNRVKTGFHALMSKSVSNGPGLIEKGIMDAWSKYQKTRKDYRDYKIRAAAKIGLKLASIGFSISTLVASSGGNVLAWRSLIKDTIKTVDELITLAKDAESVRKRAENTVGRVIDWHAKVRSSKLAAASEVGLGLLKVAIGTDCYMTFDAAANDVKAFKNKLGGLDTKSHDTAKKLQALLKAMDKSHNNIDTEVAAQVARMQADVALLIDKVIALQKEISDGKVWADNMGKLLAELLKAKSLTQLSRILKAVETASEIALSTKGWVEFSGDAAKIAIGVVKESVTLGKNVDRWMDDVKKALA